MNSRTLRLRMLCVAVMCCGFVYAQQNQSSAQKRISKEDRDTARDMFNNIANDIKKNYYDPQYHGLDWGATVQATQRAIDQSSSLNHALSEIAAGLDKLNDSHTYFLPPPRPYGHDFGWELTVLGDRCFVTQVRPHSDGDSKGIKRGDEVLALNGFQPTRESLPRMMYIFNTLRPQPSLHVTLSSPQGQRRQVEVQAAMRQRKKMMDLTIDSSDIWDIVREDERNQRLGRARFAELDADTLLLKFPAFFFSDSEVGDMIEKARKHKALIIDLRGNPGGSVETLKALIGGLVDNEVKIGDRLTRGGSKPMNVKPRGHNVFAGKLIVLVDSESGSAAETFSRAMQLEKRATVLGDKTAGAVMEAKHYSYKSGVNTVVIYGASITEADIIMSDGKRLERTGVTPDEIVLPTASDLAANRDPVIVRAAALCGATITPEAAGALFPYEWPDF